MRVPVVIGQISADHQDKVFRNHRSKRLQLSEMWAWIYCHERLGGQADYVQLYKVYGAVIENHINYSPASAWAAL
jgi:hypothetical protein